MKRFAGIAACALVLGVTALPGSAQTAASPQAQLAADSKAALARYESDKKLCNDEATSSARLQCRRDARQEYDAAVASAKANAKARSAGAAPLGAGAAAPLAPAAPVAQAPACADCGQVVSVSVTEKAGKGGAAGLIAGGVGGALVGRQIGSGTGRDLATIAGAAGGAYAGKKIEEKIKTHKVWTVNVKYAAGNTGAFEFDKDPGFKVGDAVRNSGKTIVRQ